VPKFQITSTKFQTISNYQTSNVPKQYCLLYRTVSQVCEFEYLGIVWDFDIGISDLRGATGYPLAGVPLIDSGYGFKLMNRWKTRILYTGYSGTFQIL
jgi:hypothetical protein